MWSLDHLSVSIPSRGRYKTKPPSPRVIKSLIQVPRQGQETRTKNKKTIFVDIGIMLEEPKQARENLDAPIIEDWVSDDEEEVESTPKVEKKIPTVTKIESVNTVKPSRRTCRYFSTELPADEWHNYNSRWDFMTIVSFSVMNMYSDEHQVNTASTISLNTGSKRTYEHASPEICLKGIRGLYGTKWVYRNKKDEMEIVLRNKARHCAQRPYTRRMGLIILSIAPVARDRGLWYSKDSPLELVAYTDSDYAGATLDRKSTTGGSDLLTKGFDAGRFQYLVSSIGMLNP
ncbi:hypothetical protein Tco_1301891 [Tanacetum coccineum]